MLLGDSGVGKSSLLLQFVEDEVTQNIKATIGKCVTLHRILYYSLHLMHEGQNIYYILVCRDRISNDREYEFLKVWA